MPQQDTRSQDRGDDPEFLLKCAYKTKQPDEDHIRYDFAHWVEQEKENSRKGSTGKNLSKQESQSALPTNLVIQSSEAYNHKTKQKPATGERFTGTPHWQEQEYGKLSPKGAVTQFDVKGKNPDQDEKLFTTRWTDEKGKIVQQ